MSFIPLPRVRSQPTLYLDFDGVLHPQDVWIDRGEPYVRPPRGHLVFEHAHVLASLLRPYPPLKIVLSTSWARRFGYRKTAAYLPGQLQARCVGATSHLGMGRYRFDALLRGEQVLEDVARRTPSQWLALDDDPRGWNGAATTHLVQTHPTLGICDPGVLERLKVELKRFSSSP